MATMLYLGTDAGALTLKSDNGSSWEIESRNLQEWSVSEVAVNASTPNVVFAGTRGDGVWRSEDFGRRWQKPCYGRRGPGKVQCLAFDPHDHQRVYAGCEPIDIFISDDAGASWDRLDSVWDHPWVGTVTYPVASVEPHVRDIAVDPKDPRVMYIALQVGYILKSTDGGATWKLLEHGLDADVHTIAIDPDNTDTILIATGGHDSRLGKSQGKALFRSGDAGGSWTPLAMEFDQEYSIPLVLNPSDPSVAYAALAKGYGRLWNRPTGAEGVIIRSKDGGQSWETVALDVPEIGKRFATSIAVDPTEPANIYAALDDGGLLYSNDGGDSWRRLEVSTPPANDIKCVHA